MSLFVSLGGNPERRRVRSIVNIGSSVTGMTGVFSCKIKAGWKIYEEKEGIKADISYLRGE